jgi:KTSC domain
VERRSNKIRKCALSSDDTEPTAMPSTAIRNIAYDLAKRELKVTFVTGRRYAYADVPPEAFQAFTTSSSRGAFFNREIRDRYETREITPASSAERNRWVGGGE